MKQLAVINPENAKEDEISTWRIRRAARAVVFDSDGKIAIQHVTRDIYFKLPGGGIEEGEEIEEALKRECLEETGCEIEILDEIGAIVEYRKSDSLKQISYCYRARVKGEKGRALFTPPEIEEGSELVWLPYAEAITSLQNNQGTTLETSAYMVPRDLIFLEAAKEYSKGVK